MASIKVGDEYFQYNEGARSFLEETSADFQIVQNTPEHVNVLTLPRHHAHRDYRLGVNLSGNVRRYDDLQSWEQEIVGRPRSLFDNYPE